MICNQDLNLGLRFLQELQLSVNKKKKLIRFQSNKSKKYDDNEVKFKKNYVYHVLYILYVFIYYMYFILG